MQINISGCVGHDIKTSQVPSNDGSTGTCTVTESALGVKVAADATDWYLIKLTGDALAKASQFITKGSLVSVVGELTFEDWIDESQTRRSQPVVTVSDLQLPAKFRA
jgi:single-stranded DNA-binding protein